MEKKIKINTFDGLRTIGAVSILCMHVLANSFFELNDTFVSIVSSFSVFIELFFILSGFGMCYGYYDKIKKGQVDFNIFYKNRYVRILPFFVCLLVIDFCISFQGVSTIIDAFSESTLLFCFIPYFSTSLVGVGWFLGVIFAFYCIFPFFCYTIWTKRRAWVSLVIGTIFHFICKYYYTDNGTQVLCNIALWMVFFIIGGILYLYNDTIKSIVLKFYKLFIS